MTMGQREKQEKQEKQERQERQAVAVVLFHSALGLRPGVHGFADELRAGGNVVHTRGRSCAGSADTSRRAWHVDRVGSVVGLTRDVRHPALPPLTPRAPGAGSVGDAFFRPSSTAPAESYCFHG